MIINFDLERDITSTLLKEPSLIKDVYLEDKWFLNPIYQEVYVALNILDGGKQNIFEIYAFIKSLNAESEITFSYLSEMQSSVVTTTQVSRNAHVLHSQYLKTKLINFTKEYSESANDETFLKVRDTLTELERLGIKNDDGELAETYEIIEKMLESEGDYGIKTYAGLDMALGGGLYGGMLVTIGARPGIGKTAFGAVNLVEKAIKRNKGLAVDVFTLEMSKREMVNRYVSMKTGITTFKLRNPKNILTAKEKNMVKDSLNELKDYNMRVHDSVSTIQDISHQIKSRVFENKNKPFLVVIDYLGLIRTKDKKRDRRLEIEEITRDLKIMANELNIVIILLSQLSRGIESRQDKTPVLSDLRESGSIEQDSNVVAFLHNPDDDDKTKKELIIQKNREGSLGIIEFKYLGDKMIFEEMY